MGPLPAEMPKIKSGTSGLRRERLAQRGELKSAGGGDSRGAAGSGRVLRQDQAGVAIWAGTVRLVGARSLGALKVSGFLGRRPQALRAASDFLASRWDGLKHCVGPNSRRDV